MAGLRVIEFIRSDDAVWNLPAERVDALARRFPAVEFVSPADRESFERELPRADVVLGPAVNAGNFGSAERLKWIHLTSAGVGHALFPALAESEVVLTNSSDLYGEVMAEHALALLLAFARKLHLARDAQREHRWTQRELLTGLPPFGTLAGASLGLVGMGAVGGALARRARALGMTVRAVVRRPRPDPAPAHELWPPQRLGDLVASSDALVLAAPHTAATRGLMSRALLERMPAHAVLVNLGRGALVDEEALIDLLRRGRIAGAALDVFIEEPLPPASPLWDLPGVIVTPHVSGLGPRLWERAMDSFAERLSAWIDGRPLMGVVEKREGY